MTYKRESSEISVKLVDQSYIIFNFFIVAWADVCSEFDRVTWNIIYYLEDVLGLDLVGHEQASQISQVLSYLHFHFAVIENQMPPL